VADLGYSDPGWGGGGYGLAEEGRVRERGTPPAGGPAAWAPDIFFLNQHFKGHVYAAFMYFLNIILHYIIPKRH
jgi:hypothetical protein